MRGYAQLRALCANQWRGARDDVASGVVTSTLRLAMQQGRWSSLFFVAALSLVAWAQPSEPPSTPPSEPPPSEPPPSEPSASTPSLSSPSTPSPSAARRESRIDALVAHVFRSDDESDEDEDPDLDEEDSQWSG